ncbi:MAG: 4'-phosphopantetheinyl transferase superfamily protein [Oceanospirillales bacterium]|nr:4'-phosphopantetheinyl transferase superfamily protein [Oceanospirillales bacterium]
MIAEAHLPLPDTVNRRVRFATADTARLTHQSILRCATVTLPQPLRRAIPARQLEFRVGRLCAQKVIHSLTGESLCPGRGAHGEPLWPSGVVGSISHSGSRVLVAAARESDVPALGLDIEALFDAPELADHILTPQERVRFHHRIDSQLLTTVFSAKESLYKALFPLTSTAFYFHDAEVIDCTDNGRIRLRLLTSLSEHWPAGALVQARWCRLENYIVTAALP